MLCRLFFTQRSTLPRENICFFQPDVDFEKVLRVAKLAAIHDDIMAMPMQYNSLIGDMGTTLSGGQKQRVLLARVLYRNPQILFLDEATSHLDIKTESLINEAVKHMNITRIIVAHRAETIQSADRIMILKNKKLTEISKEEWRDKVS
ncbi:ATP-binding cassette domain-containing protein [Paraneptunicella aestuarii]|nr:ATP-binding cassette domain-containing protein [Paraneptunicella aestuarii]